MPSAQQARDQFYREESINRYHSDAIAEHGDKSYYQKRAADPASSQDNFVRSRCTLCARHLFTVQLSINVNSSSVIRARDSEELRIVLPSGTVSTGRTGRLMLVCFETHGANARKQGKAFTQTFMSAVCRMRAPLHCQTFTSRNIPLQGFGTSLHEAAASGDTKQLQKLMYDGAPVDGEDAQGRTALHHAVMAVQLWACEILLQSGATVNYEDLEGNLPLHMCANWVAQTPDVEIIRLLVQKGADVARQVKLRTAVDHSCCCTSPSNSYRQHKPGPASSHPDTQHALDCTSQIFQFARNSQQKPSLASTSLDIEIAPRPCMNGCMRALGECTRSKCKTALAHRASIQKQLAELLFAGNSCSQASSA